MTINGPYFIANDTPWGMTNGHYVLFGQSNDGIVLEWNGSGHSYDLYRREPAPFPLSILYTWIDGVKWYLHNGYATWSNRQDAMSWLKENHPAESEHFI